MYTFFKIRRSAVFQILCGVYYKKGLTVFLFMTFPIGC